MPSREANQALSPGVALVLAVLAISWGSIFVRLCHAPPLSIACYRMALAAALLAPFALRRLHFSSIPSNVLGRIVLAGAFLAVHFGAWIWSLDLTSIGSSVVLVSTQPLFSALISGFALEERAPAKFYVGIAVSVAGTLLISRADWGISGKRLMGDALAVVAAAAGAGCFVVGRAVRSRVSFVTYFFLLCATAAIFLAAAALAARQPLTGYPARDYFYLAALAILPTLVGHGCLNWAVRHLRVYLVNLAAFGEPILATVYAWILFGEPITPSLLAGGGMIASGILLSLQPSKSAPLGSH
ncbi:MAG: DMT family transporter [Acidobacteria bacterium]|nr:DMT family transporter [Acidobacteriota bacterium]